MSLHSGSAFASKNVPDHLEATLRPGSAEVQRGPLQKKPEDTSSGCRGRAAQSLVAAAAMDTQNGKTRMEASAATWTVRAELLLRLEERQQAREAGSPRPPSENPDRGKAG